MNNEWLPYCIAFVFLLFFGSAIYAGISARMEEDLKPKCLCAQLEAVEE